MPKMSKDEYRAITRNEKVYEITYRSQYSRGKIIIDTKYYNKVAKKFTKALKDCFIESIIEVNK